jgi:methyl-accepting chemotaxis protein
MERVVRNVGEGDLTHFTKLRPKDELKDLADAMNDMTMGLRNKVINLKENLAQIHENIDGAKASGNLEKLDMALIAVEAMEESLGSFTLEKERRAKKKVQDEEEPEKENSEETEEDYSKE